MKVFRLLLLLLALIICNTSVIIIAQEQNIKTANIEFESPDLIVSYPTKGGDVQIVAYKDKDNGNALVENNSKAFRWFSDGHIQPVRLPGEINLYTIDSYNYDLILNVRVLNDLHKEALIKSANNKYGKKVNNAFDSGNIFIVPFEFFEVTIPIKTKNGERIFKGNVHNLTTTTLEVIFDLDNQDDLDLLKSRIDFGIRAFYRYAFKGAEVRVNRLSINASQIQELDIKQRLVGSGGKGYVSRYQMAELSAELYFDLNIEEEYEIDEEKFSEEFIQSLVRQVLKTQYDKVDFKTAIENLSDSFFPTVLKDLEPDQIAEEMGKVFEKKEVNGKEHIVVNKSIWDEGKNKLNTSGNVSVSGSVLGLFSAGTDIKFALSKEEEWKKGNKSLDDQLREISNHSESNVEWDIKGNKIIAKSVNVANTANANFSRNLRINRVYKMRVDKKWELSGKSFHTKHDIAISESADTETQIFDKLKEQSIELTRIVPIGTVLDWWSPNKNIVPDGFLVCDGSIIKDDHSPLKGEKLPDLRNKFVRGSYDIKKIGTIGGTESHTHAIPHTHKSTTKKTSEIGDHEHSWARYDGRRWWDGNNKRIDDWDDGFGDGGSGEFSISKGKKREETKYYTTDTGRHNHDVTIEVPRLPDSETSRYASNQPPYVELLKIMRVR